MANTRKQYTAEFKLKVVLESLQRETTIEEVRKKFGVSTSMIHQTFVQSIFWKRQISTRLRRSDLLCGYNPAILTLGQILSLQASLYFTKYVLRSIC